MRKGWKKILVYGICASMVFEYIPVYGEGQEQEAANQKELVHTQSDGVILTGKCGDNATFTLYTDGTFVISGTGAMYSYSYDWKEYKNTSGWADYINRISKVVIEDGITTISPYSFYECENLTEVSIPDSVNSIGKDAFYWCKNIEKVSIDTVGAWCQIDFENNNSTPLQFGAELYVAGVKTTQVKVPSGITEMKPYVFGRSWTNEKSTITSIQLPDTVTTIRNNAFSYNYLKSINIPESVTSIGQEAFAGNDFSSIELSENVKEIDDRAFMSCKSLQKIELPDSAKELGESLFANCSALTEVKLPQGINAIKKGTFSKCTALTGFAVPETVTKVEESAFDGCSNLLSIELPEQVNTIGDAVFRGCSSLKAIALPEQITSTGNDTFSGCSSLEELNIPEKVTSIGTDAFYQCDSLKQVNIPDSVTTIGKSAFYSCGALSKIVLPENLTAISEYTFYECSGLNEIVIPEKVTTIGESAFYGCKAIDKIEIPDSVETIGAGAFKECEKAESIVISNKVQNLESSTFAGCTSAKEIKLPENVVTLKESVFKDCSSLEQINIPASVKEIKNYAFENCTVLKLVNFEGDAPAIGVVAFKEVTATCYYPTGNSSYTAEITTADYGGDLKWTYEGEEDKENNKCGENATWTLTEEGKLIISGSGSMYDYSVSTYEYAPWYDNRNLITSLEIEDDITYIGAYAFYRCYEIEDSETSLPGKLTGIGEGAFKNSSIKSIGIPEGVTSVGKNAFAENSLVKVSLPSTLKNLPEGMFKNSHYLQCVTFSKGLETIGDSVFYGCYCLNSVEIPEGVTSIGSNAFQCCGASKSFGADYSCNNFKSAKLPSTLKYIGEYAFTGCQNLSSVNIPEGVTEIKEDTFSNCYKLPSIVLPKGIKKIGRNAFGGDTSLKRITFTWNAPEIDSKAFDGGYPNQRDVTANCYYPSNNLDWTSSMFQNYGGKLTWIGQEMEKPSGEDGSNKEDNTGDNTGDNKGDSTGDNTGDNTGGNNGSGSDESEDTASLGFTAHSLTLDGEIGVNFYLELNNTIINDSSARMEMVVGGKNITIIHVSDAVAAGTTKIADSKGVEHNCYKFSCKVNAKQMTDTITATLKTSSGNWKETYSVQQYANEANKGSDESLKNIVNAMLTYGAYAQQLFGYNTGSLAGGTLGDVSSVSTENLAKYQYAKSGSEDNLSLYGASLLLKEKTTIRVYYKLKSGNIDAYKFMVDSQSVTPKKSSDDLYYIEAQDIAAQDLDQVHTFQGGNITVSNYSALSYVKTVLGYDKSTEDNKNTMSALYLYWQAAEKYFY